jgi:hypothetical protein
MTDRPSLCIHAHFYQPPREDPLTNRIPDEPGAEPYHNWNERILNTCYRPNAELGNYGRISFNIGPTLSAWMAENSHEVLQKIVAEDRCNAALYGTGNALAQPYNHTILPLANRRDKETQVRWGIEAFKNTYGRDAQGMWLPETAVNMETLNILAQQGIQFTILAPWQVEGTGRGEGSPYRIDLENGRSIILFTYNDDLSSRVSFDQSATSNADTFAENYLVPAVKNRPTDSLTLIATDGELYGHHQIFRDKFLAHLVNGSTSGRGMKITYPALWLKENPMTRTTRLRENTSWSCHHGIERWRGPCGCCAVSNWKKPLRDAFNILADAIDEQFEKAMQEFDTDPWEMRNRYIDVILGKTTFVDWLSSFEFNTANQKVVQKLERLFQAQYERQRMFTSCGWFFDSIDRIEPRNNISYAAHAVWLMEQAGAFNLPYAFNSLMGKAASKKTGLSGKDWFLAGISRYSADISSE